MNDTVIIFFTILLCEGLSCGQIFFVCYTVHGVYRCSAGRLYAAYIVWGWFISTECMCLNTMVVPTFCATSSHI